MELKNKVEPTGVSRQEAPVKLNKSKEKFSTEDTAPLIQLQHYLHNQYPGCVLMPAREGGKIPMYKHKNGQYKVNDFLTKGYKECRNGCLIILTADIIVVDIDDVSTCETFEGATDEFSKTVCCNTSKGRHYYFTSTPKSKAVNMQDGARKMKHLSGDPFPIDIKTLSSSGTGGLISIPPSPNKHWLRKLGECEILPLPDRFVDFYTEHTQQSSPSQFKAPNNQPNNPITNEIKELVDILSPSRADNYDEWIRVGWCLHNINPNNLPLWIDFSKRSFKYQQGECEKLWATMANHGLGIGSLHMWAKEDNQYAYKAIINNSVHTDIETCNGSHNAVAHIAYLILKGKYVCATANGKLWYEFNDTLWQEDKEGIHIRHELSTSVRDQFILTINKISTSLSIDDLQSNGSNNTVNSYKQKCENLLRIAFKLQDSGFKDSVVKEMREYFYDSLFMKKLDSNTNLLAFTNGVWELKEKRFRNATPDDYQSLNVGFTYSPTRDLTVYQQIQAYWSKLHPNNQQREYVIKTLARQLQGDVGQNLFHVHAGFQGSAGNGKSTFFDILEMCLGNYVRKFGVELLTAKQRVETGKPMPEFQYWKGIRMLYCTEPKHDDVLNTGIMKDLTGGEKILYRLLFSNDVIDFRPQFKMHIMCNDAPQVDGSDSGVKRRIRKIDYMAQFVTKEHVDENKHYYLRDDTFIGEMRSNPNVRMEFLRLLLDNYDHSFQYDMPDVVALNSRMYLEENDNVFNFVQAFITKDENSFFTLKDAKATFKSSEYNNNKLQTFKNDLQKLLKTPCEEQKKINGKKQNSVFSGWKLSMEQDIGAGIDFID